MADFSKLSDDQLDSLIASRQKAAASPDLSKLSDDQLDSLIKSRQTSKQPVATGKVAEQPVPPWSDVPAGFAKALIPSAVKQVENIAGPAAEFYKKYSDFGMFNPFRAGYAGAHAVYENPSLLVDLPAKALNIPSDVWNYLKTSYGGDEAIRRKLTTDPASVMMDAYTVASLGAGAIRGVTREIGNIGRVADVSKPFYEGLPTSAPPTDVVPPRAMTTENRALKGAAMVTSRLPFLGSAIPKAVEATQEGWSGRVGDIAAASGPEIAPREVGEQFKTNLGEASEAEKAAQKKQVEEANIEARQRVEEANRAQQQFQAQTEAEREQAHQANVEAAQQAVQDRLDQSRQAVQDRFGNVHPNNMAEDAIDAVQAEHQAERGREDQAWQNVADTTADMRTDAFHDIRDTAERRLRESGFTVDDPESNAGKMLTELGRLAGRPAGGIPEGVNPRVLNPLIREYGSVERIPPEAWRSVGAEPPAEAVPPDFRLAGRYAPEPGAETIPVQGVEQIRRRISKMAFNPKLDPEERAASNIVKGAVDDWFGDKAETHLTPDSDPNALQNIRAARAASHTLRERFGYNERALPAGERRTAAKTLNDIVTGDIGREKLGRKLVGDASGQSSEAAPLYDAISGAVQNPDAFRTNVRGAYAQTIAAEGRAPRDLARDVANLPTTRMSERILDEGDHPLLQQHSALVSGEREALRQAGRLPRPEAPPAVPLLPKPKEFKLTPGEAQQLEQKVVGGDSGEKVFSTYDGMLKKGGDFRTANTVWNRTPAPAQDAFRGAWLRNMGHDNGVFSVTKFARNWDSYSNEAKRMLVRDPEHFAALNKIATDGKQYAKDLKDFGNPAGTGPFNSWLGLVKTGATVASGLLAGHFIAPVVPLAAGLGLIKFSRIMASPAGAPLIARWSRIAEAYQRAPSAASFNLLQHATQTMRAAAEPKQAEGPSLPRRILSDISSRLSPPGPPQFETGPVATMGIRG